jgi:transcriptional regulator with XRE-family HTH domain
MPASKFVNVLAILRKNLSLKQSELAEYAGCSVSTIQALEVNRLPLSESLAARISTVTGVDLNWLLANDVTVPMPPRPFFTKGVDTVLMQDYLCTLCLLSDVFSRLFAAARRLPSSGAKQTLELNIAAELHLLKTTEHDPEATPYNRTSKEVFQYFEEYQTLDSELADLLDLDYLIKTSRPQAKEDTEQKMGPLEPQEAKIIHEGVTARPARREPKRLKDQKTESPNPRKAPNRSRRSI